MSKEIYYKQCMLVKGQTVQFLWIPEKFANKGKCLRLKEDDGWIVRSVGIDRRKEQYVIEREVDIGIKERHQIYSL